MLLPHTRRATAACPVAILVLVPRRSSMPAPATGELKRDEILDNSDLLADELGLCVSSLLVVSLETKEEKPWTAF